MNATLLSSGFITKREPATDTSVAAAPRLARLDDGRLACSFTLQTKLGSNDFKTTLAFSNDDGLTWSGEKFVWPHLHDHYSIFSSLSRGPKGELYLFGSRTPIEQPGESFWSEETRGLKANELIWAVSRDGGATWTEPAVIPMLIPGSAEAAGALCALRNGGLVACYSPYNTFDPQLQVKRNQIVCVYSRDAGRTWKSSPMLQFPGAKAVGAEAWVIELSDGRLFGTGWHIDDEAPQPPRSPYALSNDHGRTWTETLETSFAGQTTALVALPDGKALFLYNQRQNAKPGVYLAVVRPSENRFDVEWHELVWSAEQTTQNSTSGNHNEWTDFSFGEPSAVVLKDGTVLVALWCVQPSGSGIQYVKLGALSL